MANVLYANVTLYGSGFKWDVKDPCEPPKKRKSAGEKKQSKKAELTAEGIAKKRKRRLTRLSAVLAQLKFPPRWFAHANFDRKVKRNWEVDECREVFEKFRCFLDKNYPESWFIWVMEESDKTGIHYHLFARYLPARQWARIKRKWLELTGSSNKKMFEFQSFAERHIGYVLGGRKKSIKTRSLLWDLGRRSFWGIVHKKNMKLFPPQSLTVPYAAWLNVHPELKAALADANNGIDFAHRLVKRSSCINIGGTLDIVAQLRERLSKYALGRGDS